MGMYLLVMVSWVFTCGKTSRSAHLKYARGVVCHLSLVKLENRNEEKPVISSIPSISAAATACDGGRREGERGAEASLPGAMLAHPHPHTHSEDRMQ